MRDTILLVYTNCFVSGDTSIISFDGTATIIFKHEILEFASGLIKLQFCFKSYLQFSFHEPRGASYRSLTLCRERAGRQDYCYKGFIKPLVEQDQ